MRSSKFTDAQRIAIPGEAEAGVAGAVLLRTHVISRRTVRLWQNPYGCAGVPALHCLKELERENARLQRMHAEQALALTALQKVSSPRL